MKKVQAYTALFDIGRGSVDGRTLQEYKDWLTKTLLIFPDIIVFHDGSLSNNGFDERFMFIDKNSLNIYQHYNKILTVLKNFKPKSYNDITYRLPEYGLVQFSKFELGKIAANISNSSSVIWVDAGISRFLNNLTSSYNLQNQAQLLLNENIDLVLEIDLRKNIDFKKFKISTSEAGTCRRIVSGTSFWVETNYLNSLCIQISDRIEDWLQMGLWDNEQVMLRNLDFSNIRVKYVLQKSNQTGSVGRNFLKNSIKKRNIIDKFLSRQMAL
jgi:hypothetical protein